MTDATAQIQSEIDASDVVLFMKGTPMFPQCGFSASVVQVLSHMGVSFKGVNVLEDDGIRQGIKEFSSWPPCCSFGPIANTVTKIWRRMLPTP